MEQVPDSHIVWKSNGAKGHVDGAVTFTALGLNLTRVLLVMEYYPQGLFERIGNIWRAQGRRARLEFQHFRRHAMTDALLHPDDLEGWRGEIRDSEIVKTHEELLEEEQGRSAEHDGQTGDDAAPGPDEQDEAGEGAKLVGPADEADELAEEAEEAEEADEPEEYEEADGPIDDEDGEPEAAEESEEYEDVRRDRRLRRARRRARRG